MPYGTSALSSHILFSQFRGPFAYNMADDGSGGGEADADKAGGEKDQKKADAGDKGNKKKDDKADDTEGRISTLVTDRDTWKKKAQDYEEAEKKRKEDEAKAQGKHEELANQFASERDTAAKERDDAKAAVQEYEEMATSQIEASLKTITDEEKRKSAKAMLDGLSVREQYKRLPEIMKLVGGTAAPFGGATPASTKDPDNTSVDAKQARYTDLLNKKEPLTPTENAEFNRLMKELQEVWNAKKTA